MRSFVSQLAMHNTEMHGFDPHASEIKYFQYDKNTCVLIITDSVLFAMNIHVA